MSTPPEHSHRTAAFTLVELLVSTAIIALIMLVLALYRTQTTWPGLLIVLTGIPVYRLWGLARKQRAPFA